MISLSFNAFVTTSDYRGPNTINDQANRLLPLSPFSSRKTVSTTAQSTEKTDRTWLPVALSNPPTGLKTR